MKELVVKDLYASVDGKMILKGINLTLDSEDTVAILGPNGHGKSTLLNVLMGDPKYKIEKGQIIYKDEDITFLPPEERSKKGFFLSFQAPPSISGVISMDFFKMAINAHREKPIRLAEYYNSLTSAYADVSMDSSFMERPLNEGFSGGERKRNEILQMLLLKPSLAMLDEIDSGLDIDALTLIAENINKLKKENKNSYMIVSHYNKLFQLVEVTKTYIIVDGKVVLEGNKSLAERVTKDGYQFLSKEYNISLKKEDDNNTSKNIVLGTCAVKTPKKI